MVIQWSPPFVVFKIIPELGYKFLLQPNQYIIMKKTSNNHSVVPLDWVIQFIPPFVVLIIVPSQPTAQPILNKQILRLLRWFPWAADFAKTIVLW